MLLQNHPRGKLSGLRWDTGQVPAGCVRSAVACRLIVARAAKLSAKDATEDVHELLTFQPRSTPTLKVRRSLVNPARRARPSLPSNRTALDDDEEPEGEEEQDDVPQSHHSHHRRLQQRRNPPGNDGPNADEDEDGGDEDGVGAGLNGDAGFRAASLRDATATASTSGHAHLTPQRGPGRAVAAAGATTSRSSRSPPIDFRGMRLAAKQRAAAEEEAAAEGLPSRHAHGEKEDESGDTDVAVNGFRIDGPKGRDDPLGLAVSASQPVSHSHPLPPGLTTEHDKGIYTELRGCEDWRDVLDVVADEAELLSLRTAVQALTRLNMLSRREPGTRRELVAAPVFVQLTNRLHEQVSSMNNIQLSNTLYALAQLGVKLDEEQLATYFAACQTQADIFYPRDIATMLSAAATMRAAPPQELLDVMGFRATTFLNRGAFDARSIPTLLHACALLGYKNPILAQAAAQQLAAPGVMAGMEPQGVANCMWALARMGTYHPPAVEAALAAFTAAPQQYRPQECANLLWSLAAFRHHPQATFAVFANSLLDRLPTLRAADVATLMYALGCFNVSPGQAVLKQVAQRVTQMLAEDPATPAASPAAGGDGAASSSSASATGAAAGVAAGEGPAAGRGRGRGAGGSPGSGVNLVELCNMYWGLALLREVEIPLFATLEGRLAAEWERAGGQIPESLMRMIFQGFLASRLAETSRPVALPPLMMDACKRAWTTAVVGQENLQRRRHAVDHVAGILDKLKVTYDKRRPTGDGLALIDLAFKAGPETYVALQVLEDVQHCANDPRQLLGTTIMQRQLLEKNGWEVRYLVLHDLEQLTPEVQPMFVADLLSRLGVKVRLPARHGGTQGGAGGAAAPTRGSGGLPAPSSSAASAADAEAAVEATATGGERRRGGLVKPLRKPQARR